MENDLPEEAIDLYLDSTRSNSKAKEQQLRRDATSVLQASANFYLVGAVFAPTSGLSIECMKKYLELQQEIFERQMDKLLKEIASTLP